MINIDDNGKRLRTMKHTKQDEDGTLNFSKKSNIRNSEFNFFSAYYITLYLEMTWKRTFELSGWRAGSGHWPSVWQTAVPPACPSGCPDDPPDYRSAHSTRTLSGPPPPVDILNQSTTEVTWMTTWTLQTTDLLTQLAPSLALHLQSTF